MRLVCRWLRRLLWHVVWSRIIRWHLTTHSHSHIHHGGRLRARHAHIHSHGSWWLRAWHSHIHHSRWLRAWHSHIHHRRWLGSWHIQRCNRSARDVWNTTSHHLLWILFHLLLFLFFFSRCEWIASLRLLSIFKSLHDSACLVHAVSFTLLPLVSHSPFEEGQYLDEVLRTLKIHRILLRNCLTCSLIFISLREDT